ncbi:MAG TPA: type II toxin-antitoxin system RelE/ParE family toxin [Verrucomicrobiae bacterium]|nr:type II toxin-antitoxin system RelE/ParE family toxin [Verrucomicrobiae bacterium]
MVWQAPLALKPALNGNIGWREIRFLVDNLGNGIWEIRSRLPNRIARTLFAVVDEEIVLLHGFIKKQQQTPAQELALAKKRKKEYLEQ